MNDGRVDPFGRFLVGGYHPDASKLVSSMYMLHIQKGGKLQVDKLVSNIGCMNSICFSHEKDLSDTKMYWTDSRWSPPKICVVHDYGKGGEVNDKVSFSKLKNDGSAPDGSVVDIEGHVWTAQFGTGKVVRRNVNSGKVDFEIIVPVPHVTCLTFGGKDLRTVYITNASLKKLSSKDPRVTNGLAGGLFSARLPSHIVGGRPEYRFGARRNFSSGTSFASSSSSFLIPSRAKMFVAMIGMFAMFSMARSQRKK